MLTVALLALAQASATPVPANQVTLGPHRFSLPSGFTVRRVTGPGLVERPISAVFDSKGRLFVTESSGSNEPSAIQAQKVPHRVLRLTDTDGDGVFDKRTIFADNLMLPQGIAMVGDEVWVGAPPRIIRLLDADDDGVAEKREVWHDGGTLTGCMNDLHGPLEGPDGLVYWTKGAFARQTHKTLDGELSTRASHVFRARRDGSALESVMAGGMDNPVGIAFTDTGDLLLTCTFVHHPAGGLRDGVLHAVPGALFGKDHPPIHESAHLWTAPTLMPVMVDLGPAAPCGLSVTKSESMGLYNRALSCQFNLRRVQAHALRPAGSALASDTTDLIVSDFQDFHPTDAVEDADGSILVVDTGGWYKLCCPSSQMVKAESLGAIYRLEKKDSPKVADPRGLKIDWSAPDVALAPLLTDARQAVAARAASTLSKRGAIKELARVAGSPDASRARRLAALWAIGRSPVPAATDSLVIFCSQEDPLLRLVALRALASRGGDAGVESASRLAATDPDPGVRRAAVERLAACRNPSVVPAILKAMGATNGPSDRAWRHAVVRALVLCRAPAAELDRAWESARHRALVLTVLDQSGQLKSLEKVLALVASPDAGEAAVGRWVLSRHNEWDAELALRLGAAGGQPRWLDADLLARAASHPEGKALVARWLAESQRRDLALDAVAKVTGAFPKEWVEAVGALMAGPAGPARGKALALAASLARRKALPAGWSASLEKLASDDSTPAADRLAAIAALPVPSGTVPYLAKSLHRDRPQQERQLALEALARAKPAPEQWDILAAALAEASPTDISRILELFGPKAGTPAGLALARALGRPELSQKVPVAAVRQNLAGHGPEVRAAFEPVLAKLDPGADAERKRVLVLLAELPPGDARRGHAVFNSAKTACAACHKIGYVGGDAGPDLSRIGQIRSRQDLIEAIVAPSVSFVRSYEPVVAVLHTGKLVSGVLKFENESEVAIQTGPSVVERIPRRDVESVAPGAVSLMPAGLEKQVSPQELADLVAFLLERK